MSHRIANSNPDNACVVHRLSNFERTQLRIILRFHYTGKFVAYLGGPGHQTPVIRSSPQDDVKDALADIPVN